MLTNLEPYHPYTERELRMRGVTEAELPSLAREHSRAGRVCYTLRCKINQAINRPKPPKAEHRSVFPHRSKSEKQLAKEMIKHNLTMAD